MKTAKNIFVGFLVSFIGSLPLGYLNIAGFEIYRALGITSTVWYLLGVVSIEVFVIYFTLIFANRLMENKKLMKFIEGFSVLFILFLAYLFYRNAHAGFLPGSTVNRYAVYPPYLIGIILSCLNFIQIPFWTSWNLLLVNKNHIDSTGARKYLYVFGTALGTFSGMLALILSFSELATMFFSSFLLEIIALVFGLMGIFQGYGFYKKYYGKTSAKK